MQLLEVGGSVRPL